MNFSEKPKPHYNIKDVKLMIDSGFYRLTETSSDSLEDLGITIREAECIFQNLQPEDFYKSMTSYHNNKLWQDVYKPVDEAHGALYIKFCVPEDCEAVILSFKHNETE